MYFHPEDRLSFEALSDCSICGHPLASAHLIDTHRLYLHDLPQGVEVVSCSYCRTILQRRRLAETEWSRFNNAYSVNGGASWDNQNHRFDKELDLLKRVCSKDSAILDVGCGFGELVKYLNDAGFSAEGIDPRGAALSEGRNRFGLTLHEGFYNNETQRSLATRFDAIVSVHVFEHFSTPGETLYNMANNLKSGGFCLLTVPDIAPVSLETDIKPFDFYTPGHLFYFDRWSLSFLLEKAGFEVIAIDQDNDFISEKPILRALARKQAGQIPIPTFPEPEYGTIDIDRSQSAFIEKRETAILENLSLRIPSNILLFGTWLYGILTLHALEKNGHTIIGVVDSDEGKWNHLFSGHIIDSPEILRNGTQPDVAVVTSINGYEAIKQKIRSEFSTKEIPILSIAGGIIR